MVTILEAMLWFQPNIRLNAQGAALSLLPEQTKLLEQFDRTAAQVYQAPFTKTDLLSNPSSLLGYPQFSIGLFPILMTQVNKYIINYFICFIYYHYYYSLTNYNVMNYVSILN